MKITKALSLLSIPLAAALTVLAKRLKKENERTKKHAAELERSHRMQAEFFAMVSHELRTPLFLILNYADMMQKGLVGQLTAGQERSVQQITKHSGDLLAFVTRILDTSRIETRALEVEESDVPLFDFMNELRATLPPPGAVLLIWEYPDNLPSVKTDRIKLSHILQNLVGNAIKFTDKGQITVSVTDFPAARTVQFRVADTGRGIPEEALPVIFEMFRQVDRSLVQARRGVGLGLYIVKSFTELLGGNIEVTSQFGHGTTFTLTLPYERRKS